MKEFKQPKSNFTMTPQQQQELSRNAKLLAINKLTDLGVGGAYKVKDVPSMVEDLRILSEFFMELPTGK